MLEHSEAKVALYRNYLSIYLNILTRTPHCEHIFIFDLMCGKGSPIAAIETVRNNYRANSPECPKLTVWFNDSGVSGIEKRKYKIDRVKHYCSESVPPSGVHIEYFSDDANTIRRKAIREIRNTRRSKGLFFIDPYGYKDVKPDDIKEILDTDGTELLLFLPATDMYRFTEPAFRDTFSGGEHLREFLVTLFDVKRKFSSVYGFIDAVKERFRLYLSGKNKAYVDAFTIERGNGIVYCLLFFTRHPLGLEKMLEAKWKQDPERGMGYTSVSIPSLFSGLSHSGYHEQLHKYLCGAKRRTNHELYEFGLDSGFLPKHTNEVLKALIEQGVVKVISLDGKPAAGNYIGRKTGRTVGFELLSSKNGNL